MVPGTTLNFLKIKLGSSKISLYDTPGLFLSHQITSHLNEKELKVGVVICLPCMHFCCLLLFF